MRLSGKNGFTFLELMVVMAIMAILASVLYANFSDAKAQSRDAKRQADLRNLQNAIELYKNRYGRYPEGCLGAGTWSTQASACPSGKQYIVDLAPQFIPTLPVDPRSNGAGSGYMYVTNAAGTTYKVMAYKTIESETVTNQHKFKSCDVDAGGTGICDTVYRNPNTGNLPFGSQAPRCADSDPEFQTSYALWGGFPEEVTACPDARCQDNQEQIICQMP